MPGTDRGANRRSDAGLLKRSPEMKRPSACNTRADATQGSVAAPEATVP